MVKTKFPFDYCDMCENIEPCIIMNRLCADGRPLTENIVGCINEEQCKNIAEEVFKEICQKMESKQN